MAHWRNKYSPAKKYSTSRIKKSIGREKTVKKCFECDSVSDIHMHHVVPRSLGGTKTIPLCGRCHSLVHGEHLLKTSSLIKKVLSKKKEDGFRISGSPPYGYEFTNENKIIQNEEEQVILEKILKLAEMEYKPTTIAKKLNKASIPARGARWYPASIERIIKNEKE